MNNHLNQIDQNISEQLLSIWHESIELFNKVHSISAAMPQNQFDMADKIDNSSLIAMERIAQAANSRSKSECQSHIINATEAVFTTIACLYIASQWRQVNKYVYEETSLLAKHITQSLHQISEINYSIGSSYGKND